MDQIRCINDSPAPNHRAEHLAIGSVRWNKNSEIDNLKMTIDSMGDTIRGINEQLQLIHGEICAKLTKVEQIFHIQRDKWGAADLKCRGDTIEINERLKNAASSRGGDHSSREETTLISPKHITIEAHSEIGALRPTLIHGKRKLGTS